MKNKTPYILLIILLIPCWGIAWKPGGDLGVYYKASSWLLNGWVEKLYSDNAEIGNFFYGPFGLAILKPLALLSFNHANFLWLFLQTTSFVFFWRFLFVLFPELLKSEFFKLFVLIWVVSIKPIHASFQSHNVQLMFATILLLAEIWSRDPKTTKKVFAGVFVSLLASIKIYPAFIGIYFLIRKSMPVKVGLVLGAILSLLIPLIPFGFETGISLPYQFVKNATHYHNVYDLSKDVVSLSLPSLLHTWLPIDWIKTGVVNFIIGSISLSFFYWVFRLRSNKENLLERDFFAMSWAFMAMLNSTTRPDYFIFFVPAFISIPLLTNNEKAAKLYQFGLFISVALISFITEWTLGSRELTHYLEALRIPVLGIVLLCLMQFLALRNTLKR